MQLPGVLALPLLCLAGLPGLALAESGSPMGKAIQLMSDLQAKILKEGEEYSEWCAEIEEWINMHKKVVEGLKAKVAEDEAQESSLNARINELATSIATNKKDLKEATQIREKEAEAFVAEDKELVETIEMLARATAILDTTMSGRMLQTLKMQSLAQALSTMVQVSMPNSADAAKLTALVQQISSSEESDVEALGAPAAEVYEPRSGGVIEALGDLKEKAEEQLNVLRKIENSNRSSFEQLQQSLADAINFDEKEKSEATKKLEAASEAKAQAKVQLNAALADLAAAHEKMEKCRLSSAAAGA